MFVKHPRKIIGGFLLICILGSLLSAFTVRFKFDFEQFFPSGDDDLEFFLEFKKQFEPDDNFLLIGIQREEGVFEQQFLENVLDFSLKVRRIELTDADTISSPIISAQSLLQFEYPIRNPFTGFSTIPAVHIDQPERYAKDKAKVLTDERLVGNFISADAKTLVVVLKTVDNIKQFQAEGIIKNIHQLMDGYGFESYHLLGRANFQTEMVRLQIREFVLSTFVSGFLVFLVMLLIFKRITTVLIAVASILVGLLVFTGMLGVFGRTLDTMSLLYPIIMIIVATSDVIHVISKYTDELRKGNEKFEAIKITIKEIGMSIFLTSSTTAIGFMSLVSSRLIPIQEFGINAAIGVMLAYVSVILFTTTLLVCFKKEQIIYTKHNGENWKKWMTKLNNITIKSPRYIVASFILLLSICFFGMSKITTNTQIAKMLPIGAKVTEDFKFFEEKFSGFRPFEVAVMLQNGHTVDDYEVITELDKIEQHFRSYPTIKSTMSITSVYKSINQAYKGNKTSAYSLPKNEAQFKKYQKLVKRLDGNNNLGVLVSNDKQKTRISARVLDVGADSIKLLVASSNEWIKQNIDSTVVKTRTTGTGIIIDKNSDYVRDSLLKGLFFAILVISLIVAVMYRNVRMIVIALIPNLLPLLIAAALIGFLGIALEAGVAIVFAIIFGIAVDDTIHLLSKFKLMKDRGMNTEDAIQQTLIETGKALCLTSVILFFGFLILIFSSNPPAVTIGMLISVTLFSALICDMLIIPIMLRKWIK